MRKVRFALLLSSLVTASPAFAHTGVGSGAGVLSGFLHPVSGADHVLAMIGVGLWARLLGGAALVVLPGTFLTAMLSGGIMATVGWRLPALEAGILASIVVLWALIVLKIRPPLTVGSGICAVFAILHGYAHGAEMAAGTDPAQFGAGFLLATGLLLLVGSRLPVRTFPVGVR